MILHTECALLSVWHRMKAQNIADTSINLTIQALHRKVRTRLWTAARLGP